MSEISVTKHGHVAVVEIDRPPNNHVSVALMAQLADKLEALDRDKDCRATVLCTAGKNFCAGADFVAPTEKGISVGDLYVQAVRLFSLQTPMVAAIQGAAVGAGLGLALVADFRVVAPSVRLSANFVKLGFHPGFGLTHTLPRLIGPQRASMMFLTGRRIQAEEALSWGLADIVAGEESLRAEAFSLAREIAENAPLAIVATRATLRAGLPQAIKAQTDIELKEQTWLRETEDFAEGIRSVNERRPGDFKGR